MSRTVDEWIADHDDQAIPKRVKLRIFERCGGKCALTGRKVLPGEFDFDHIRSLIMGGEHRETNLQVVWRPAHREKTAIGVASKAKADRIRAKHLGLHKSRTPLGSKTLRKRMDGTVVAR
jgi:5-methylcytosine-specific restriction protein A